MRKDLKVGPPFTNFGKRRKLAATLLIPLFLLQVTALICLNVHNIAFASTDVYSITNHIRFTAAPLGFGRAAEVIDLDITQCIKGSALQGSNKPEPPTKSPEDSPFAPNLTYTLAGITNTRDFENAALMQAGPFTLNLTNAGRLIGADYQNQTLAVNMSDYYTHFSHLEIAYPSKGIALFFNSPYNYAAEWCATHDYELVNISSSNYTSNYNVAALNAYQAELIEEGYAVTEPLPKYGEALSRGISTMQYEAVAIAIIMVAFFIWAVPQIVKMFGEAKLSESFQIDSDNRAKVTIKAIDTINTTILNLVSGLNANIALVLSAIANGTITYQQGQALIKMLSGDYSALINNCTRSIEFIMGAYYNSSAYLFDKYVNGMIAISNWSDWFNQLLMFVIILVVVYAVYALFLRKKGGAGGGGGIVNVFPK